MTASYWQNKVCLVTGASSGLGLVLAKTLASRGATLVMVSRTADSLKQAASEVAMCGGKVEFETADVTSQADVERLLTKIDEQFGRLDLLCNCAGKSTRGSMLETSIDDFQAQLDINFLSAVRMTRTFAKLLLKSGGHLINIGSLASKVAPRFLGGYPASKFALAAYTQQLRLELGPQGLHAMLVCPGPIQREDNEPRYAEESQGLPDEAQRPAGGAKLQGIDPAWLAEKILAACESRRAELVIPWKVRVLLLLSQISPRLGDWLLLKFTGGRQK